MTDARGLFAGARIFGRGRGDERTRCRHACACGFALDQQLIELRACLCDLCLQLRSLRFELFMRGAGALAFARKPFGLEREPFERRVELAARLMQTFSDGRVRQQTSARLFDLLLDGEHFGAALRINLFRLL